MGLYAGCDLAVSSRGPVTRSHWISSPDSSWGHEGRHDMWVSWLLRASIFLSCSSSLMHGSPPWHGEKRHTGAGLRPEPLFLYWQHSRASFQCPFNYLPLDLLFSPYFSSSAFCKFMFIAFFLCHRPAGNRRGTITGVSSCQGIQTPVAVTQASSALPRGPPHLLLCTLQAPSLPTEERAALTPTCRLPPTQVVRLPPVPVFHVPHRLLYHLRCVGSLHKALCLLGWACQTP